MKSINILIGPKGSGKTFIGLLLQQRLSIPFLRVENIFLRVKDGRNYLNPDYIKEGFAAVEQEIWNSLNTVDEITVESTGAAPKFDEMLDNLKKDFRVRLIRVNADLNRCLERIRARDQLSHINVSDHDVMEINRASTARVFDFDFEIDNNAATQEQIIECFLRNR